MRPIESNRLKKRLLHAGVAPKYAQRMVQELSSHFEELVNNEKQLGRTLEEARTVALLSLGDEDVILQETRTKKELLSWSRRFPKSTFFVLPIFAYFAITLFTLTFGIEGVEKLFRIDIYSNWPDWHFQYSIAQMFFIEYMLAPLLSFLFLLLAIRRNVPMYWPMIGVLVIYFFGLGFETSVTIPDERGMGGVNLTWGWAFLPWENWRPAPDQSIEQYYRVFGGFFGIILLLNYYQPFKLAQ